MPLLKISCRGLLETIPHDFRTEEQIAIKKIPNFLEQVHFKKISVVAEAFQMSIFFNHVASTTRRSVTYLFLSGGQLKMKLSGCKRPKVKLPQFWSIIEFQTR